MATATLPAARPTPLIWLRDFLREELAPYPGRTTLVARMVITASIVMLINMTFKIPYGAFAALFTLTISRENPDATLRDVKTTVAAFAIAATYALLAALSVSGEPVLRLIWVLATLFMMFWALSALANYTAAARFGYLLVITIPLWDEIIPAEEKVTGTLWAIGSLTLANLITALIEVVYNQFYHLDNVTAALVERLQSTAALLRAWSTGIADHAREEQLNHLAILGTSRMRRDLLRSNYPRDVTQQMGAVVSLVGRLVDLAANLTHFSPEVASADRPRLEQLAVRVETLADQLLEGRATQHLEIAAENEPSGRVPLLPEMEKTVSLIDEVLSGSQFLERYLPPPEKAQSARRVFLPDAFSNADHVRFAIRGGLAAGVCYLTYNLIDWPGISTAVTTCFLTALTTVGASRQKQLLRFGGAVIGGVILGFGSQVFVLPALNSIAGFFVLFLAVTIPSAWIAAAGPRLSYLGVQIALAFYLINLQEFKFQTSLAIARDRVVGVLLGLVAMWLIFDQLWGGSAATEMKRTFIGTLRLLARLMREPISPDQRVALEQTYTLRETINSNFDKLRREADGVMLEFGPARQRDVALRDQLIQWQLRLRTIFVSRTALLKYRLHLPGFELPAPLQAAHLDFDTRFAARLDALADRLEGKVPASAGPPDASIERLEEAARECCITETGEQLAAIQALLPLSHRIDDLLRSVEQEIG